MNAVLKFPVSADLQRKRELVADIRPEPVLKSFSRDDSRALLGVVQKVHHGAQVLLDLVDSHRDVAREAGVESIAIELGSERNNVSRILDSLEESELKGSDARLTLEGLELIRRTEKLLAEASSSISRFTGPLPEEKSSLGQSKTPSSDTLLWSSVVVFGLVAVVVTLIAVNSKDKDTS